MESQLPAINDLPYDIFRQIIIYAYTYTPEPYQSGEDFSHTQALAPPFSASHVCRAWRSALLSDATMWTTLSIPEMKPGGLEELLRRSQSTPLNVSLLMEEGRMRHYNMSNALSLIFEHINRFKSLRVYVRITCRLFWPSKHAAPIRQLLEFLQRPAPRLQDFFFRNTDGYFSQPMFLNTLFSGFAPKLEHINYQVSAIAYQGFSCPLFHGLRELHLTCFENASLENVLALLELSSSLEVLGIYIDWPWLTHESERSESVNLPYLQRLVLRAYEPTELINFVNRYLTFPPNVKWDINVLVGYMFEDSPSLIELLPQVRFTSLHVLFKGGLFVQPSDETTPTEFNQIDGNKLTFSFGNAFITRDWCDLLMIHSLAFSSVTHFDLESPPWGTFRVEGTFSVMENLQYLLVKPRVLFRSRHEDLPWLKGLSVLTSPRQDGAKLLCPLLRQITVKLEHPFNGPCTTMLHEAQRESGCPLKIVVNCPELWHFYIESDLRVGKRYYSRLRSSRRQAVMDLKISDIQHQTLNREEDS